MKIENLIGWCDETTNAVTGCDKVSPGCKNCYAESGTRARVLRSQGIETWGPKGVRHPVNFEATFRRLNKLCICDRCHTAHTISKAAGNLGFCAYCELQQGKLRRIRLFADSNSDWLDRKWTIETRVRFLDAIRLSPNVDVQLLTKRIGEFKDHLKHAVEYCSQDAFYSGSEEQGKLGNWIDGWISGNAPRNVWLGVSAERQQEWNERVPLLRNTPAAVRFVSAEPLLGYIDCGLTCGRTEKIDWVIVGAESGRDRRDVDVDAIESVVRQCANAAVPVYCKQDGALISGQRGRISDYAWSFKQFPK